MVSGIGGTSLAQSMLARLESRKTQAAAQETTVAATASTADAGTNPASVTSAQSAAAARVGDQLDAQFDAARLQRAQDDKPPAPPEGATPPVDGDAGEDASGLAATATGAGGTDAADGTEASEASASAAPAAAGGAGGARMGGGAPASSSSSDSASTDYIAEADTNNDRKVSEQERIAYARKQASEAEKEAAQPDAAQQSRAQEVQQAYLPQETSGSQLDTSA